MNKLKHAFFNTRNEDKRTLQFLKMQTQAPFIGLSDLTEKEKAVYASWWKDLDPFGLDLISNEKTLSFLKKCCLEDSKLEEILILFETVRDGLNKGQFFAMLRLIAHAQNGRNISRALIYIGAPIPTITHYDQRQQKPHFDTIFTVNNEVHNDRKFINNWWDQTNTTNLYNQQQKQWHQKQQQQQQQQCIDNNPHIRSKSATTPELTLDEQGILPSSLSLYNLTNDRGQSLLLTKAFVYQSPATRNKELQKEQQRQRQREKEEQEPQQQQQQQEQQQETQLLNSTSHDELENPFYDSEDDDDDDSDDTLDSPFTDDSYTANNKVNSYQIPPPPVPAQSTKPAFLKYTRNNSYPKRSQSTKDNHSKKHVYQHQRHKSISSTSYSYSHYLK